MQEINDETDRLEKSKNFLRESNFVRPGFHHWNRDCKFVRRFRRSFRAAIIAMTVISCIFVVPTSFAATTYYVSGSNGDDSRLPSVAQNINTPWKTIQHAANNMTAGDTCLIRAGVYRETVTVANSGTFSAPITFQAYNGEVVTLSGTDQISGWTQESANVYSASMNGSLGDGNQIFQGDGTQAGLIMLPEARWPNVGSSFPWQDSSVNPSSDWAYVDRAGYDTNGENGWFTDEALPVIDWTGCTVHIMSGYGWIMQHLSVTAYNNSTHTLTTDYAIGAPAYQFTTGNEYYITGSKDLMDGAGEWFYDDGASRLYFYSDVTPPNVEAKKRNYAFDLCGKSYIKLINLDVFACTIKNDSNSTNCTFDGMSMRYLGNSSKNAAVFGLVLRDSCTLCNSELAWDSRGLIKLAGSDIKVINNCLHDSGYVPTWTAMVDAGINTPSALVYQRNLISHNTMHDSGRSLMGFPGRISIFEFNDLYNGMKLTTDGGVFYSNFDAGNSIVRYNLIHDSVGPTGHSGASMQGFYLDCQNSNWIVHHNIIWNIHGCAMEINARSNFNMVFNNTCWNTSGGSIISGFEPDGETGSHVYNNLFNGKAIGNQTSWDLTDILHNFYMAPGYQDPDNNDFRLNSASPAIDAGVNIPGVTDGFCGNAPDMGALEYGTTNWTAFVGCNFESPPSPAPVYDFPTMIFANQIVDGSFESGTLSDWSSAGDVSFYPDFGYGSSWADSCIRTGGHSLRFRSGASGIQQTIANLLPNRRYKFYCGTQTADAGATVTLGVSNHGYSAVEISAVVADSQWHMFSVPFVTGPSSTSAEIYIQASGVAGTVYVDDAGVELYGIENDCTLMPVACYFFNESIGTTAHDCTTNDLDGTLNGNMTDADWVSGKLGNALEFDGVDDYVDCGNDPSLQLTGDLTLSFWIKPTNVGTGRINPLDKAYYGEFALTIETDGMLRYYHHRDAPYTWWGSTAMPAGTIQNNIWQHIVITRDTASRKVKSYYNGELQYTLTYPADAEPAVSTNPIKIGRGYAGAFAGKIDDVRIYDHVLDKNTISSIIFSPDATRSLALKFDENTGLAAWDCSENGNKGTLNGNMTDADWVSGKLGNALEFDGVDDYVDCGNDPSLQLTGNLTLSFWVYPTDISKGRQNPIDKSYGGEFAVTMEPNGGMTYYHGTARQSGYYCGYTVMSSGTLQENQWQLITITRDTATRNIRTYYNGNLKYNFHYSDDANKQPSQSNYPVRIGKGYAGAFAGKIDDVRIYSRCLSLNEVLELATMLNSPYEGLD